MRSGAVAFGGPPGFAPPLVAAGGVASHAKITPAPAVSHNQRLRIAKDSTSNFFAGGSRHPQDGRSTAGNPRPSTGPFNAQLAGKNRDLRWYGLCVGACHE